MNRKNFVHEQQSEAIFARKEIASSPEPALSTAEGTPRNDLPLELRPRVLSHSSKGHFLTYSQAR